MAIYESTNPKLQRLQELLVDNENCLPHNKRTASVRHDAFLGHDMVLLPRFHNVFLLQLFQRKSTLSIRRHLYLHDAK